ncbi:MAG: DUF4446 family protein [Actinobacteria bacterium]|nr:DUF4446 family protein [Actinomycetota bacterium]
MGVAIGSLILALFGIGWIILAVWLLIITVSMGKITTHRKIINKARENGDFVKAVSDSLKEFAALKSSVEEIKDSQSKLGIAMDTIIRNVGMVRFDAFDDISGKLSFAIALLNDHGDGVVISTINGRQESRSYAKLVKNGDSSYMLSAEEQEAIAKALPKDKVKV